MEETIFPKARYLARALDIRTVEEARFIIEKSWNSNEALWLGKVPLSTIDCVQEIQLEKEISAYFDNECYNVDPDTIPADREYYNRDLEMISKLCWLTEIWLTEGFRNRMGCHWNPRLGLNVIHPGDTRKRVIDIFPNGDKFLEVYYFNTLGIKPKWMDNFVKVDFEDLMDNGWLLPGFVPDHGTLIPHLQKDIKEIPLGMKEYHSKIYNRVRDISVKSNYPIKYLKPWEVSSNESVEITFEKEPNVTETIRAIVAVLIYQDIDIAGVKVVHKDTK